MYSCWARGRVCTRVWPRYSREKQIPCNARDSRKAACLGRRALQNTGCARGHRAGGSEDPPLQIVEGAEIRMGGPGRAALAALGKGERKQRGNGLGAIGGNGKLQ